MAADFGLCSVGGCLLILLVVGFIMLSEERSMHKVEAENKHFTTVPFSSLVGAADPHIPFSSRQAVSGHGGSHSILQVVHNRNSQLLDQSEMLRRDDARVKWLQSKMTPARRSETTKSDAMTNLDVSIPTTSGSNVGTGNYLVTVGLGTPEKQLQLEMDTGSSLTWTQCQPCSTYCYNQTDPIFDPSSSSTYSNIPCPSSTCDNLYGGNPPSCYTNNSCGYSISYGDSSQTNGSLATDTLTLTSSVNLPNYIFGCGQDNEGLIGSSDGLFGLSNDGVFSMVTQGASQFGEYFSYCLPSSSTSTGYLVLGNADESAPNSTGLAFTPIITLPENPEFYGIEITGISVGGVNLSSSSSQILMNSSSIIDSGTVISRLPQSVYAELRSNFQQQMTQYPTVQGNGLLDTCYDFSNFSSFSNITFPSIIFNFVGGLEVTMGFNGTFYVYLPSQVCLAFATPNQGSDLVIYGNVQQRTFEIAYDVANKQLGFSANACS